MACPRDKSLIAYYALSQSLNYHAQLTNKARGLIFGLNIPLSVYFTCASSECPGEPVQMHSLARAFTGRQCDKHQNLM